MVGLGTRSAIERAESGNSQPKTARASALPDSLVSGGVGVRATALGFLAARAAGFVAISRFPRIT